MFSENWHPCPHCRHLNSGQPRPDLNCEKCHSPSFCQCPFCGERLSDHWAVCCHCLQPLSWQGNYPIPGTGAHVGGVNRPTNSPADDGNYELEGTFLIPSVINKIVKNHNRRIQEKPSQNVALRTSIVLRNLKILSPEIAVELRHAEGSVHLPDTVRLDIEAARLLSEHSGPLHLEGLTTIDQATAFALAKHPGRLSFGRLQSIEPEIAEALVNHTGTLAFHRLKQISEEAAKPLSLHSGRLELVSLEIDVCPEILQARLYGKELRRFTNTITVLSPRLAACLIQANSRDDLLLDGLAYLPGEVAKILATSDSRSLSLGGLQRLQPAIAEALGQFRGHLKLDGVVTIDDSVMKLLARAPRKISLRSLKRLPTKWCPGSEGRDWELHLYGVTTMTASAARRLSQFGGTINVDQGNWLTNDILNIFLESAGRLRIADPDSVLPRLAERIRSHSGAVEIAPRRTELDRILSLIERKHSAPRARTETLVLSETSAITPSEARRLARWPGKLVFEKQLTLTAETAIGLADHTGELVLRQFDDLTTPVLRALIQHNGILKLFGNYELSDDNVRDLTQKPSGQLVLDPVSTLSLSKAQRRAVDANPRIALDMSGRP